MEDVIERNFSNDSEIVTRSVKLNIGSLHITPIEIIKKEEKPDEMGYFDLQKFIDRQERSGHNVARWKVELYSKISFPFASFIVVFFGVPFAYGKRRSGLAIQFGISLLICFIYLAFIKVSQVFGYRRDEFAIYCMDGEFNIFIFGLINLVRVSK